jgi:hypothetical protein
LARFEVQERPLASWAFLQLELREDWQERRLPLQMDDELLLEGERQ